MSFIGSRSSYCAICENLNFRVNCVETGDGGGRSAAMRLPSARDTLCQQRYRVYQTLGTSSRNLTAYSGLRRFFLSHCRRRQQMHAGRLSKELIAQNAGLDNCSAPKPIIRLSFKKRMHCATNCRQWSFIGCLTRADFVEEIWGGKLL